MCVWGAGGGGVNLPRLFINMADLSQQSRQSWSSGRLRLPSPTWRTQTAPSRPPKGSGTTASLWKRSSEQLKRCLSPSPHHYETLLRPRLRTCPPTPPRTQISQSGVRVGCEIEVGRTNPRTEERKTTSPTENRVVLIIIA